MDKIVGKGIPRPEDSINKVNKRLDENPQVQMDRKALRDIAEEKVRRKMQELYRLDPMAWLEERLGENPLDYKWSDRASYAGHTWDGTKDPLYTAWMHIACGRWTGIEAGTGTGKTFLLARVVLWFLDCYDDSLVVTSAPKQQQLSLNLWAEISKIFHKFKRIRPKANLYNLRLVVEDNDGEDFDPLNPDFAKSWHAVGFVAGVGSEETSATKAQGFHREHMLIVTEETPGMPNAVMTAFKNTCTGEHNVILAVGNPDSQLDPLHKFVVLPQVKPVRLSALDYPNVVEDTEIIKGAVTKRSVFERLAEMGEKSALWQSRVRGVSPAQSTDSLIKLEWCYQCRDKEKKYDGSFHAVGVDVANSIDGDKAALAWGKGQILMALHDFYCENATDLAYNIILTDEELATQEYMDYNTETVYDYDIMPGMIGVDGVGVGVATVNALDHAGWEPLSLQGGQWEEVIPEEEYTDPKTYDQKFKKKWKFQGLRSQMWWEAREDLRLNQIGFSKDIPKDVLDELFVELVTIKVTYKDNFISVESKDTLKKRLGGKSPNKGDAFVYWNWTRKGHRLGGGSMPVSGGY